ncbi:MAG: RpiB/LacA/LacB family sugar-phosphate isomerase [Fervidicoccaceae archaeon]
MSGRIARAAVGSDDNYGVVKFVAEYLASKGFEVIPVGSLKTGKPEPWPLVGYEVGKLVSGGEVAFGVVVCYTGTGVSIAANKVRGVRAALCFDAKTAEGARRWNDANVLALSARLLSQELAKEIIDAWLSVERPDESESENIRVIASLEEAESAGARRAARRARRKRSE